MASKRLSRSWQAKDDIECGQCGMGFEFRRQRLQRNHEEGALGRVGNPVQQGIVRIQWIAGKIHLRDKSWIARVGDHEMYMWWPRPSSGRRIGSRLDCAEVIGAVGIGNIMAVALKVRIKESIAPIPRVVVTSKAVRLPNLDSCLLNQLAGTIEYPPDNMQQPPPCPAGFSLNVG